MSVAKVVHRFHHRLFGEIVQRAGGFIQNQHLRVVVERAGNADALALPAREAHAALAHGGGVALRQSLITNSCRLAILAARSTAC